MKKLHPYDKVAYLLQGGGALGSYQVGVCEGLLKFGLQPDWLVGTSIGAINASIIAGNHPQNRIAKLNEFWNKIRSPFPLLPISTNNPQFLEYFNFWSAVWIAQFGLKGFFKPRLNYPWFIPNSTPDKISFYDTSDLKKTLLEVIDFDIINNKQTRLTLGAVNVKTGELVHFDNKHQIIGPEHVMASGALPPGFPAIKIDNEYFWDGGLSSNTPFSEILTEKFPQKLLCVIINLFSYYQRVPRSMAEVIKAKKELEFNSKHKEVLRYFCELHFLQNTIQSLPNNIANDHNDQIKQALKRIKDSGHPTSLNIIRFHYADRPTDLWSKDYNFSQFAIEAHWQFGYRDAQKAIAHPSWLDLQIADSAGAMIHEF